jgi:hypothetical protein
MNIMFSKRLQHCSEKKTTVSGPVMFIKKPGTMKVPGYLQPAVT